MKCQTWAQLGNKLQTRQSDLNLIKVIKGKMEKRKGMTATKEERKEDGERKMEKKDYNSGRDWNPCFGYRVKRLRCWRPSWHV